MKPIFDADEHSKYQDFLIKNLIDLGPNIFSFPSSTWDRIVDFYSLDLSFINSLLSDFYYQKGPIPRLPSNIFRSYLLSLKLKVPSITTWVRMLHETPLYAILSGFDPNDVPGIGTFYDFFSRLWDSDNPNLASSKLRYKKKKTPKGKKKGEKTPNIKTTASARFIDFFSKHTLQDSSSSPINPMFQIFKHFLNISVEKGLIDLNNLSLAGDGTPVRTSARMRYKKACKCSDDGNIHCSCKRNFSQPDCDMGWDSSRECYFHGYHLYIYVDADSDNDLPIFPLLERASRHDMLSFLHSFFTMKSWIPEATVKKLMLDAAHDSDAVYTYCNSNGITPFIDLNPRGLGKYIYEDTFYLNEDGRPICVKNDLPFTSEGIEPTRRRRKWRCPLADKSGCKCENPCTNSSYGRVVHTTTSDNPRLLCEPRRDSKEWKLEYNKRTSVERSNKRQKDDYKLENGRHRSTKMWYCRLYCIMMLQHLDAWEFPSIDSLKGLLRGMLPA